MCGSQFIQSKRSSFDDRGSIGSPVGSGIVLTLSVVDAEEQQHACEPIKINKNNSEEMKCNFLHLLEWQEWR